MFIYVYAFFLIGCAGFVGISLASRVLYIFRVRMFPLCGHCGGVGGGIVQIFLSLWLRSGGYGAAKMVKGVVRVFLVFPSLLLVLLAVGCLR